MTVLSALILGVIQGITEFLPISSSAHLALMHWLTGWTHSPQEDLIFDVALHFGTLLAILIYFGRDWANLLRRRDRLVACIIVACIPGAIAGALLEDQAETIFRDPLLIAGMLALMGLLMAAAEKWSTHRVELGQVGWRQAITVGLAQALAIMPGVSRSGITMTAGLLLGFTRETAARFSFLLATPILLGATLWSSRHLVSGHMPIEATAFGVGIVTSALVGLASIHFLLRFLQRHTFYPFVIYRLALAALVVVIVVMQGRSL